MGHHAIFQVLGDGDGQGSLVCCCPWSRKELDMTERLKNNNMQYFSFSVELRDLVYHTTQRSCLSYYLLFKLQKSAWHLKTFDKYRGMTL